MSCVKVDSWLRFPMRKHSWRPWCWVDTADGPVRQRRCKRCATLQIKKVPRSQV